MNRCIPTACAELRQALSERDAARSEVERLKAELGAVYDLVDRLWDNPPENNPIVCEIVQIREDREEAENV